VQSELELPSLEWNEPGTTSIGIHVPTLARALRSHPGPLAGIAFGLASGLVAYFSWTGSARHQESIALLCVGVGLSHAVAGAASGRKLIHDATSGQQAVAIGALTSAIALLLFTPGFAYWISSSNANSTGLGGFLLFVVLVGLSTLAAGWWAAIIVSAALGRIMFAASRNR
jgi:hypothetical protein